MGLSSDPASAIDRHFPGSATFGMLPDPTQMNIPDTVHALGYKDVHAAED